MGSAISLARRMTSLHDTPLVPSPSCSKTFDDLSSMTSPSSESVALTTSTSRISRFPTIGVAPSRRYRVHLSPPYLPQVQPWLAQYSNDVWLRRWCRPEHPGGSASASKDGHAHAFLRGRHVAQFNCDARCTAEACLERSGAATSDR